MKEPNENIFISVGGALIIIGLLFWLILFSGCKVFQDLKKEKSHIGSDSVNVKKESESLSKVDTSKSKSESAHNKETVYYPQPIYIEGKDGETKVVFVPQTVRESGTNKEETQNFNFENYRKDIIDSMRIAQLEFQLSKRVETKVDVLGIGFWIGVSLVGLVLIGLMVMILRLKNQFTSINNLLTKNTKHD